MANVKISELTELAEAPAASDVVPIVDVSASLTKKLTITNLISYLSGAVSTILTSNLTADRALRSSSTGKVEVASVTATELGYVSGVTSAIQTQLGQRLSYAPTNLIYNGNFDLWDLGTSGTITDDAYILPGWNALEDSVGAAPSWAQQTSSPPDGSRYFMRLTANSHSTIMLLHFLESQDAIALRGKSLSVSLKAKTSSASNAQIRVYALSWTGTADSLTSDVVGTWPATGSNLPPVAFAASWTEENSPAAQNISDSWTSYSWENIAVDTASTNNVAIGIYINVLNTLTVDLAQVQAQIGATATAFTPRPVTQEKLLANRRFWRYGGNATGGPAISLRAGAAETIKVPVSFPVEMRTTPTKTVNGTWALTNCTGPDAVNLHNQGFSFSVAASGSGLVVAAPNGTDDYIDFNAEL